MTLLINPQLSSAAACHPDDPPILLPAALRSGSLFISLAKLSWQVTVKTSMVMKNFFMCVFINIYLYKYYHKRILATKKAFDK